MPSQPRSGPRWTDCQRLSRKPLNSSSTSLTATSPDVQAVDSTTSLGEKLGNRPILLEVIPPHLRATTKSIQLFLDKYVRETLRQCRVDAINLPEIADENFRGEPFYRNMDPREFTMVLREQLGPQEIVANKIVVHLPGGREELADWARATRKEYGIDNVVAVGGTSSNHAYPGPTVVEANELMKTQGLLCGNIMIPDREDEARRMVRKTESGANFFTTQVIFTPDNLLRVLAEYDGRCRDRGVEPATVLVSLAPVSDGNDLDFLRWLGVEIGPETATQLTLRGADGLAQSSMDLAVDNWERILAQSGAYRNVSLGLNLEYINRHNFRHAPELGARLMEVS